MRNTFTVQEESSNVINDETSSRLKMAVDNQQISQVLKSRDEEVTSSNKSLISLIKD